MKSKVNNKGFTLIELLAVIIIMAVIMGVAVTSISRIMDSSKRKTTIQSLNEMVKSAQTAVVDMDEANFRFADEAGATVTEQDPTYLYFIPWQCFEIESGTKSGFGKWDDNKTGVFVVYNSDGAPTFGFQFRDNTGHFLNPTSSEAVNDSRLSKEIKTKGELATPGEKSVSFNGQTYTPDKTIIAVDYKPSESGGKQACKR